MGVRLVVGAAQRYGDRAASSRDACSSPVIHIVHTRNLAAAWWRWSRPARVALGKIDMTNWKAELDSLVDETMAFVKSVRVEPALPRAIVEPNRMPSVNWMSSEREEIRQRVANFKAHQQRFMREREDFVASEWRRMMMSERRS
jgi:hypothetical protein